MSHVTLSLKSLADQWARAYDPLQAKTALTLDDEIQAAMDTAYDALKTLQEVAQEKYLAWEIQDHQQRIGEMQRQLKALQKREGGT